MHSHLQLSHAQRALWFLHHLAPDSAVYHTGVALAIRSAVDPPRLAAAVAAAAQRHDMLRSRFHEDCGQGVRSVDRTAPSGLEVREVPGMSADGLRTAARRALHEPFRLETEGAFRFVLLRRSAEDAVLLMAGHHIATDATSNWLVMRDVLHAYEQLGEGGSGELDPLRSDYDQYVTRERSLLDSPRGEKMERYWHQLCEGAAAAELPTDRPRPVVSSRAGSTYHLDLTDGRIEGLRELARASEVSLFSVLLGTFQGLLHRFTRQNDFLVGCPTTTRISPPSREVVGNFINTLVFRAAFTPSTTFRQAFKLADQQVRGGLVNAAYPFELLTRGVNRPRTSGGASLCRITFNLIGTQTPDRLLRLLLDGAEGQTAEVAGLTFAPFELPQAEGQLDLAVNLRQSVDTLAVDFRYDVDLFEPATIERFAGYFTRALDAALAAPDAPVARLSLVDEEELARLLAFGGAPTPVGGGRRRG